MALLYSLMLLLCHTHHHHHRPCRETPANPRYPNIPPGQAMQPPTPSHSIKIIHTYKHQLFHHSLLSTPKPSYASSPPKSPSRTQFHPPTPRTSPPLALHEVPTLPARPPQRFALAFAGGRFVQVDEAADGFGLVAVADGGGVGVCSWS